MSTPLRDRIDMERGAATLRSVTVLSEKTDPYRRDTPANHVIGGWYAEQHAWAKGAKEQLHVRGLHYAIVTKPGGARLPEGKRYDNTDEAWTWLENASRAARWLGYVPFGEVADQRNDPPIVWEPGSDPAPHAHVMPGSAHCPRPRPAELEPHAYMGPALHASGFRPRQPYRLVIFGEKSGLADVVLPLARSYRADAYLGAGELSDTLIYRMARNGAEDGRPMVVLTLTDFDPAGRQMSISIARKLQALRDLEFEGLAYHVVTVALTFAQVRRLGLPSTPLKESERRAGKWWNAFHHEQTEIDALAQLQSDTLRRILRHAIRAYRDPSLKRRALTAEADWRAQARAVLDAAVDQAAVAALQAEADAVVTEIKRVQAHAYVQTGELVEQLDALTRRARELAPRDLELPPVVPIEPELNGRRRPHVLATSAWSWLRQTRQLKAYRDYADGNGGAP